MVDRVLLEAGGGSDRVNGNVTEVQRRPGGSCAKRAREWIGAVFPHFRVSAVGSGANPSIRIAEARNGGSVEVVAGSWEVWLEVRCGWK